MLTTSLVMLTLGGHVLVFGVGTYSGGTECIFILCPKIIKKNLILTAGNVLDNDILQSDNSPKAAHLLI